MKDCRNYREHLIEKLKDDNYAHAFFSAVQAEACENSNPELIQVAASVLSEAQNDHRT
jgi:hypothetical protein